MQIPHFINKITSRRVGFCQRQQVNLEQTRRENSLLTSAKSSYLQRVYIFLFFFYLLSFVVAAWQVVKGRMLHELTTSGNATEPYKIAFCTYLQLHSLA